MKLPMLQKSPRTSVRSADRDCTHVIRAGVDALSRGSSFGEGEGLAAQDVCKRLLDAIGASAGLIVLGPTLLVCALMVWGQDRHSPFYLADRVGRGGRLFRIVKLRSMIQGADSSGVTSTSACDHRITALGHKLRRSKLDELPQLWNVLKGDMSLVGPRPQVISGVRLYTREELCLLRVRPGITDLASIVFADEGEILRGEVDPDMAYDRLIRPWKSRLGLLYVEHRSLGLDCCILWLTILSFISRRAALAGVAGVVMRLGASPDLCRVARRQEPLRPHLPPGHDQPRAAF